MAGGLAHEINNPLAIIGGLNEYIRKKSDRPEIVEKYTEKVIQQIDRIKKITGSLLSLYDTKDKMTIRRTTLNQIFSEVHNSFYQTFLNNDIKLTLPELAKDIFVEVDPNQFAQVVFQLIENSVDAISNIDDKWIKLDYEKSRKYHIIRIIDCGTGIDNSIVENLFDPFFTTKDVGVGTGLGLSVAKKVIENYHGKFYYSKHVDSFTSFVIELPILKEESDNKENDFQNVA